MITDEETGEERGQELDDQDDATQPRRRVPWTYALIVSLVAFTLWLLLDAPTLQHNAQVSPVGTRRTISLAVLRPIATVSRDLGLSHVVSVADGVLGRHGNQPVDGSGTFTAGPSAHGKQPKPPPSQQTKATIPGATTTTTVPAYERPTAAAPLRVLVIGDSLGIDLEDSLVNDLANTGVVTATGDGQVSTGLTRPDYYNWPVELQTDLSKYNPQVVVIMLGANDNQDFPGPPDIPYGTAQWNTIYAQRVQSFMAEAASNGAKVIWVGMPPMQDPGLNADMQNLDSIYQAQAAQNPSVTYLSSTSVLGTPQGGYTPYIISNGQEVNVREEDGTHISPGGGEVLSQAVMGTMRSQLHIQLPG